MFYPILSLCWLLTVPPYCSPPTTLPIPLEQSQRVNRGPLIQEDKELLVRALEVVADEISAKARGMLDVRNRTVELARAERIRVLSKELQAQAGDALVAEAILEYRRNIGVNSSGNVEVGLQLPLSREMDPLVRETLKAFRTDSRGAPYSTNHYVAFRLQSEHSGQKIENPAELIDLLGVDHPVVVEALAEATKTEPQFIRANILAAQALETNVLHLLTVYRVETINTYGTGYYPGVGTVGLINWTPAGTALHDKVESGEFTVEGYLAWLSSLSRSDQVEQVVEYLQDRREMAGNYHSVAGVYLSVLNPSALKEYREKGLDGEVFSISTNSLFYHANSNLDRNRDAKVSVGEVIALVMDHRRALLKEAEKVLEQKWSFRYQG